MSVRTEKQKQKVVVVGAGPVGALAALYAAGRGDDVEVYELRSGMSKASLFLSLFIFSVTLRIMSYAYLGDVSYR